ncbi:MAG: hypothetical protein A2Z99_00355 [Treponema sp. GWB1_62_6]|nr:MAG: hypothetical protein A2Z99_00355 [Treponema sp. GWB1_62_6]
MEAAQVDIEVPNLLPKDVASQAALKFDASAAPLYELAFVLYTNKSKPIDVDNLRKGNSKGYKIETDGSIISLLGFKALPTTNIEGSFRKTDQGVIDGYIYSQLTADPVLRQIGLKSIKRELYDSFNLIFAIPKGRKGGPADLMLVEGMKKIKASGKFDAIFGEMVTGGKYNPWQP